MTCNEKLSQVYKWDDGKKDQFLASLNSKEICHKMEKLSENLNMLDKSEDLDLNLKEFYSCVKTVLVTHFSKKYDFIET